MTPDKITNVLSETGQTMAEYAVVLSLIILVTLVMFTSLGNGIEGALKTVRMVFP
jgi:Flp pilus assembly pilin Flp